jgi:hypothetical protein
MKKNVLVSMALLMCLLSSCCKPIDKVIDATTYIYVGGMSDSIVVDSLLKIDTSYYRIYTFRCGNDTIFQYKFTSLLAPGQQFNAQFIPYTEFFKYSSDYSCKIFVTPSLFEWDNPNENMATVVPLSDNMCYLSRMILTSSLTSSKRTDFNLDSENEEPRKRYYTYNWESKVHYDYMRYNADSAIITLSIYNMDGDSITPIDSANILFPNSNIARTHSQFPVEIKDTIYIVEDTTYNYTLKGFLKGQASGQNVHVIRVHKNEIISDQNHTLRYQGSIYEYDYEE